MQMHPAINFFHSKVCHVCKLTSNERKLKYCSKCHLVAYCGVEHQKLDWKKHKKLCNVVVQVNNLEEYKEVATTLCTDRLKLRSLFMNICESLLKRNLTAVELSMIYFENKCAVCDEKKNLTDCRICLSYSTCSKHNDSLMHNFECQNLKLCLDSHIIKSRPYFDPIFDFRKDISSFHDMESFINNMLILQPSTSLSEKAFISDLLTRPLTVYYALSILKISGKHLKLDIVGSTDCEVLTAEYWKILKIIKMAESMHLNFIGPEITEAEKKNLDWLTLESTSVFYRDFVKNSNIPSAVVVFNCGLHEFEDEEFDTWGPSLSALVSRKVPIILTSYTLNEAVLDIARLRSLDPTLRVLKISNPFASLSPLRDVESSGVFFINSVLSILVPS